MSTAIVLGAGGFLGRHIHLALAEAGWQVVPGPSHRLLDLATASPAQLRELVSGADLVVNATGAVSGDLVRLQQSNVFAVASLVTACTADSRARLIHLGSLAEYGLGRDGANRWRESDPHEPLTAYGRTKAAGSDIVLAAAAGGALDGVVLRVANPVGAGQPRSSLLGSVMAQVAEQQVSEQQDGEVRVGSLDAERDFVAATDVAGAVVAAATVALPTDQRAINVGSGVAVPVRQAVRDLLVVSGFRGTLHEEHDLASGRSAGVTSSCVDVTRARQLLGWSPTTSLKTALRAVAHSAAVLLVAGCAAGPSLAGPGGGATGTSPGGAGTAIAAASPSVSNPPSSAPPAGVVASGATAGAGASSDSSSSDSSRSGSAVPVVAPTLPVVATAAGAADCSLLPAVRVVALLGGPVQGSADSRRTDSGKQLDGCVYRGPAGSRLSYTLWQLPHQVSSAQVAALQPPPQAAARSFDIGIAPGHGSVLSVPGFSSAQVVAALGTRLVEVNVVAAQPATAQQAALAATRALLKQQ